MLKTEKATYSRIALEAEEKQLKGIRLTVRQKAGHYTLYYNLKQACEWLEDNAGNPAAFYSYHLEQYKDRLYHHFKSTTKAELSRLARLAKKELLETVQAIFQYGEQGSVNII